MYIRMPLLQPPKISELYANTLEIPPFSTIETPLSNTILTSDGLGGTYWTTGGGGGGTNVLSNWGFSNLRVLGTLSSISTFTNYISAGQGYFSSLVVGSAYISGPNTLVVYGSTILQGATVLQGPTIITGNTTFTQPTNSSSTFTNYLSAPQILTSTITFGSNIRMDSLADYQSIAIGFLAGTTNQNINAVAIGNNAGSDNQNSNAIAIGVLSGNVNQHQRAIAIGDGAGNTEQGERAIGIGYLAGSDAQDQNAVAIGNSAGNGIQGPSAVAIGTSAGYLSQSQYAIAVGCNAGFTSQGISAVAIGVNAGQTGQGGNSVAIGNSAGNTNLGQYSIAIGSSAESESSSYNNVITLNATDSPLNAVQANSFNVKPIRAATTEDTLYYNPESGEITYGAGGGGSISSNIGFSNVSVLDTLSTSSTFTDFISATKMYTSSITFPNNTQVYSSYTPRTVVDTFASPNTDPIQWTVPQGVSKITVQLWGAGGGGDDFSSGTGGNGAYVKGDIDVSPGEIYSIRVGGGGSPDAAVPGGGAQVGGGGASQIVIGDIPIAVAGGGGGGVDTTNGGYAGTSVEAGGNGGDDGDTTGGGGATGNIGGAGGNGNTGNEDNNGNAGQNPSLTGFVSGGTGGNDGIGGYFGGGGGGGWAGGGGGGYNADGYYGGGGGGSSYVGGLTEPTEYAGNQSDSYTTEPNYVASAAIGTGGTGNNGLVVITYELPIPSLVVSGDLNVNAISTTAVQVSSIQFINPTTGGLSNLYINSGNLYYETTQLNGGGSISSNIGFSNVSVLDTLSTSSTFTDYISAGQGYFSTLVVGSAYISGPNTLVVSGSTIMNGPVNLGSLGSTIQLTTSVKPSTIIEVFTEFGGNEWTVPDGVSKITVQLWGAGGGTLGAGTGGNGAYVQGDVAVIPGHSYSIHVGQGGEPSGEAAGGGARIGGGGASQIVNTTESTPIAVAGGGGGAGDGSDASGGYAGTSTTPAGAGSCTDEGGGGGGASGATGGVGGSLNDYEGSFGQNASETGFVNGGTGANNGSGGFYGGGGGGGWAGGGGGAYNSSGNVYGGGGGGSSYVGGLTEPTEYAGNQSGFYPGLSNYDGTAAIGTDGTGNNGLVVITYELPIPSLVVSGDLNVNAISTTAVQVSSIQLINPTTGGLSNLYINSGNLYYETTQLNGGSTSANLTVSSLTVADTLSTSSTFTDYISAGQGYFSSLVVGSAYISGPNTLVVSGSTIMNGPLTLGSLGSTIQLTTSAKPSTIIEVFNSGTFTWTVPNGVTNLTVQLWGAGGSGDGLSTGAGGNGAYVKGDVVVSPGETYSIGVGQAGSASASVAGGGAQIGGGGASYIFNDSGLQVAIAGGGGGGANNVKGGYAGTDVISAEDGGSTGSSALGGGGANGATEGIGGYSDFYAGFPGQANSGGMFAAGGDGGNDGSGTFYGGGGGGGWAGGGGGGYNNDTGNYGAGGGGSSYIGGLTGTVVKYAGYQTGQYQSEPNYEGSAAIGTNAGTGNNGLVVITYDVQPTYLIASGDLNVNAISTTAVQVSSIQLIDPTTGGLSNMHVDSGNLYYETNQLTGGGRQTITECGIGETILVGSDYVLTDIPYNSFTNAPTVTVSQKSIGLPGVIDLRWFTAYDIKNTTFSVASFGYDTGTNAIVPMEGTFFWQAISTIL